MLSEDRTDDDYDRLVAHNDALNKEVEGWKNRASLNKRKVDRLQALLDNLKGESLERIQEVVAGSYTSEQKINIISTILK